MCMNSLDNNWYVSYFTWYILSHSSASFILYPHFWQTDQNLSCQDLEAPSSKSNYSSSPKSGEANWTRSK